MASTRGRTPAILGLTRALAAIRSSSSPTDEQREEVRTHVCALTDEMKQAGHPPERIIIKVRALARAAGIDGFADPLVSEAVRWCLDRYFPADHRE